MSLSAGYYEPVTKPARAGPGPGAAAVAKLTGSDWARPGRGSVRRGLPSSLGWAAAGRFTGSEPGNRDSESGPALSELGTRSDMPLTQGSNCDRESVGSRVRV
jgi:hypothetical protein